MTARAKGSEMAKCKDCGGLGAVRWRYPNPKPIPSYWFTAGAKTCGECDGSGEAKSPALHTATEAFE